MKIIAVGDIHGRDKWMSIDVNKHDKIIFLGDYTDSYTESNMQIYDNLKAIIQFKKTYPDKVVLLLGNHDVFNYWYSLEHQTSYSGVNLGCSGYRQEAHVDLYELFQSNAALFQIAHQVNDYIFSHAGIHSGWYKYAFQPDLRRLELEESSNLADDINNLFSISKNTAIMNVGYCRGGNKQVGGPLWCDKLLSSKKPLDGYHQIVGHTPIKEITTININDTTSITYCDCLETKEEFYELEI